MARTRSTKPISHRDLISPTSGAKPFNDAKWIWELKHDGYRALLIKDGERTSLFTRKGNDLLRFFPEIAADLNKLPDCAIDGELVMLDEKGKPEFQRLRGRCAMRDPDSIDKAAASKPAAVFAFDILSLRGRDLRQLPLFKRKAKLEQELRGRTSRIVFCQHVVENGEKLFEAADQLGLEGVICKRADSQYVRGRTTNWVKVKTPHGRRADEEQAKWNE